MKILLEKANEHVEKALEFEQKGDKRNARQHYLKASQCFYEAAKKSKGKLKERRVRNAEKLYNKAESLKTKREKGARTGDEEGAKDFVVAKRPSITFKDVAGLENVKEEIRIKLIYPFKHPDEAKRYGIGSGGGILLYGPPGTGKTYIAKAVANEVDASFFSIKPSEIMSKWVGEAEKNIERLFSTAREQGRSVIFIDEVEALIPKRSGSGSTVMKRVVPQILAELEGFESNNQNLLFIGATNEPWSIDPAAMRPGRFDDKIYVHPPDLDARKRLFELNLKDKPLSGDIDLDELANITEGYSGADIRQICIKASVIPFKESIETGEERKIEMRDLKKVIDTIRPSISEKMMEKYEKFSS